MTNVAMGPQPSSLFEPPPGYTAMDMPAFGGFGGGARGGRGRGAVPPAGVPAGLDPAIVAQMQALGLDSIQMAMMAAMGTATNSAPWEAGDGWVVDMVVTASGSESGTGETGSWTRTYSARYTASVPFTYGTPAVGAAMGPAWQLVATLGSPRGLAQPLTFSGTSEFLSEVNRLAACEVGEDGTRVVMVSRGTGTTNTADHSSMAIQAAQARWELSGDLRTHHLLVAVGAPEATEATETTTTTTTRCPNSEGGSSTDRTTSVPSMTISVDLTGLPLASSPSTMRGSATAPMRFDIGLFDGELPANVEWTLRPIE
jgi:hypothetical protein